MKKTMICASCMLIGLVSAFAQDMKIDTLVPVQKVWKSIPANHWSVAVKGGVNNFLLSPPAPTTSDRYNLSLGGNVEYTFNPFYGMGLEFVYSDYSRPYIYNGNIGKLEGATNDVLLFSSVNLSNAFATYRDGFWSKLNIYSNVGAGVAFFKGNLDGATAKNQSALMAEVGLNAELKITKTVSLSLEGRYHQYDALYLCEGSRSNRNGDALMLLLGLRCKLGKGIHVRNIDLCEYAPKTIPVVAKTTFVKGESPKTLARIQAVEKDNDAVSQKIKKLENDAKALLEKKAALATAEKNALQKKLEDRDKAAALLAKKVKDLEEKARLDSLTQQQALANRTEELIKLSARDSVTANKLRKMEEDLKNLATQDSGSVNLTLENVQFKSGSNILLPMANGLLNQVAGILMSNTKWKSLKVSGHTDNVGADANNMKLSQLRAATVKKYLVSRGLAADKIVSVGFGETMPVATNDTPEGRQKNRRVEFEIK